MLKRNIHNALLLISICIVWTFAANKEKNNFGLRVDLMPIPTELGVGVALEYTNPFGTFISRSELAISGGALFLFITHLRGNTLW